MDTDFARFRVLLAEDDPVSLEFIAEGLRACGAEVVACRDGDAALAAATAERFALLVLDHQLPGRNGDAVLQALRADPAAASHAAPALATSAEAASHAGALAGAGFLEVLAKPMAVAHIRDALQRQGFAVAARPPLDDVDALRACGSTGVVARLRRLFADEELPRLQAELDRCTDAHSLQPVLHRLRASCGFCGTPLLAHAAASLHRALTTGEGGEEIATALVDLRHALAATRAALHSAAATLD